MPAQPGTPPPPPHHPAPASFPNPQAADNTGPTGPTHSTSCRTSETARTSVQKGVCSAPVMGLRKLSPGGHEYLTNAVACSDRQLEPGELLSDYYLSHGYPASEWFGAGAELLGLSGAVTPAQMQALYGEGRHPNADAIEAQLIAEGTSTTHALAATKLGRHFPSYSSLDHLRSDVNKAYQDHNREQGHPFGAPIDPETRARLRHQVQVRAFQHDHAGDPPGNERELQKWLAEQKRALKAAVSGFELVFAPDKSVSIAWAIAQPPERERIADLVRQAARDALSYVEQNAAYTRRGAMGEAQVDVDGITAALFEHWDSRAADPHFHIHALVSNKVRRSDDGHWTALDGRTILAATVTASEYFDSRLRDLFREQGAQWTRRPADGVDLTRPVWQLGAVPVALVRAFSQRHRQFDAARARRIVEFRAQHGREPTPREIFSLNRQAQYDNRPGKQPPRTLSEHLRTWRAHAETVVSTQTLDALEQRLFNTRGQRADPIDIRSLAEKTCEVVSENYSHFSRWNLEAEAHRQSAYLVVPADKRAQLVADVVDAVLNERDTLPLEGPSLVPEPASLRRRKGESVFHEHHSTRYTVSRTLAAETDLVAWARRNGGHRLSPETVAKALAHASLNEGQRSMVTEFARSGRRLQLALAPAGAGKTSAMKVFAAAWRRTGHRVYAFGPSARAAQELGAAIGARPHTLHQLTTAQGFGFAHRMFPMNPGDVVIIDEAAMAGTHTLHAVVSFALRRGADVRLIGDDQQLAAVEAGGAIRLLAHDVGAIRFGEIVRFRGPDRGEQAAASLQIRDGNPDGLDFYLDHNRVRHGSLETMRDAVHRAWRADLQAEIPSLLIVPTNEDTIALNIEARQLRGHGTPAGQEIELHDGTRAGVGDWVVTRHNQRLLSLFGGKDFVKNGDTWDITAVHHSGRVSVRHRVHGGTVTLPAGYARAHVELAYATTVNRVQGMTSTGNAHLLIPPTMTREQFYPGITRAAHSNFAYVVTHHHVIDQHRETPLPQTPRAVLTGILHHTGAEVSATETLRHAQLEAESLATLVKRYNYTATYRDEERYTALLRQHAPPALQNDGTEGLIHTLRNAHDLGWSPDELLHTAIRQGPLDRATDPAALLQHRIIKRIETDQPPPATAEPRQSDITQWRRILDAIAPHAAVEDPPWALVWRRAAGGIARGLHVDAALTVVAHQLAQRPGNDPMPDHHYAINALTGELDRRHDRGEGHRPALPWMARPDLAAARDHPGHADYLRRLNEAIAARTDELRATAIRTTPAWTTALGPRLNSPVTAEKWDDLVGMITAYRETFKITDTDPALPLGPKPGSPGAKAHVWTQLTKQCAALHDGNPPDEPPSLTVQSGHLDQLSEPIEDRFALETLDILVRRHDRLARDGDEDRLLDLIARHAPDALNQPAEHAALLALSRAQDHGWQAEHLLRTVTEASNLATARDPAAVLASRIDAQVSNNPPPPRTAAPEVADIERWTAIIREIAPETPGDDERWNLAWRHAAAGKLQRLDADRAVEWAAQQLAVQPVSDPMPAHRYVAEGVAAALSRQYDSGHGHHPALPWLAVPELDNPGKLERLTSINAEIIARIDQLRDTITRSHPTWATGLGERPSDPRIAARWDDLVLLAAAYRETYRVTDTDTPIGHQPTHDEAQSRGWRDVSGRWTALAAEVGQQTSGDAYQERPTREGQRDELRRDEDLVDSTADEHVTSEFGSGLTY